MTSFNTQVFDIWQAMDAGDRLEIGDFVLTRRGADLILTPSEHAEATGEVNLHSLIQGIQEAYDRLYTAQAAGNIRPEDIARAKALMKQEAEGAEI